MVHNTRYPLTDAVECTVDEYRLRRDGIVCGYGLYDHEVI